KEIIHVSHLPDDLQFVFEPLAVFRAGRGFTATLFQPLFTEAAKELVRIPVAGDIELWEVEPVELKFDIASFGYSDSVLDGFGYIPERFGHFLGRLYVKLVGIEPHAVLIRDLLSCLDAKEHFMGFCVLAPEIMGVICGDQRYAGLPRQ